MKNLYYLSIFVLLSSFGFNQRFSETQRQAQTSTRYSAKKALQCLEDYFDFYKAAYTYRDPNIRRVSNNVFKISLYVCEKRLADDEFFWHHLVLTLTIKSVTKYRIDGAYF